MAESENGPISEATETLLSLASPGQGVGADIAAAEDVARPAGGEFNGTALPVAMALPPGATDPPHPPRRRRGRIRPLPTRFLVCHPGGVDRAGVPCVYSLHSIRFH